MPPKRITSMPKNVYVYMKDEAKLFLKSMTRCELSGKCIYSGKDRIIKNIYWKKIHLCITYVKTPLCTRNDHLGNQLRSAVLINERRLCPRAKDGLRFGGERQLPGRVHL